MIWSRSHFAANDVIPHQMADSLRLTHKVDDKEMQYDAAKHKIRKSTFRRYRFEVITLQIGLHPQVC
jgi:hypothetical protein